MPLREAAHISLEKRLAELYELEKEQIAELKQSFGRLTESISPSSLLKNSIKDIVTSPGLRSNLVDAAVGIGAGVIGKKLFVGKSNNLFKKIGGTAIEFFLSHFVRNRMPQLRKEKEEAAGGQES
ncbi:MAG: hypothetical protein JNM88_05950 [Chitinophagaceae bacterium]|nr:hypothetical protein [Chitinophagaceae bacterium]